MAESLADILEKLNFAGGRAVKACQLLALWARVVDQTISQNSQAVKLVNKVLYVTTSSPSWAQELTFLKSDIIKKFNLEAGEEVVTDIRFKSSTF